MNPDGTAHESNGRAMIDDDDDDFWFGFEQEYFLWEPETNLPLGFPKDQTPQGQFYCSVGGSNAFGREIMDRHLDLCLDAGINVEGTNAEVAPGQWEYQTFAQVLQKLGMKCGLPVTSWRRLAEVWFINQLPSKAIRRYRLEWIWNARKLLEYNLKSLWF